jgi:two-component system, OmpR family, response regulator
MQTGLTDSDGLVNHSEVPWKEGIVVPMSLVRKLLLVDDEVDGAEFAAALLKSHGLQVIVAHCATEALQALQENKDIDAVLTDIMMPGMSGLQLAASIRESYPAVKIVLMSGQVLPDLLEAQDAPYLFAAKPYRIDTILELLSS